MEVEPPAPQGQINSMDLFGKTFSFPKTSSATPNHIKLPITNTMHINLFFIIIPSFSRSIWIK
jgi:hypothetical protein